MNKKNENKNDNKIHDSATLEKEKEKRNHYVPVYFI
jgi:hypothetical protein